MILSPADEKLLNDATKVFEGLDALPSMAIRARVILAAIAVYVPGAFKEPGMNALLIAAEHWKVQR